MGEFEKIMKEMKRRGIVPRIHYELLALRALKVVVVIMAIIGTVWLIWR